MASRVNLLDENKIFSELEYLKISVEKTAGPKEKRSWEKILLKYINEKIYENKLEKNLNILISFKSINEISEECLSYVDFRS